MSIASDTIAIISCGNAKQSRPAPAGELYTGGYFRALLAYAKSILPERNIFILSAKHGLLRLDQHVAPYNVKMGSTGCITSEEVHKQAAELNLLDKHVIMLAGNLYRTVMLDVWPEATTPLPRAPMGVQIAWLRTNAR